MNSLFVATMSFFQFISLLLAISAGVVTNGVKAFTPTVVLSGPVGEQLRMQAIPRSIAYKYMKMIHTEYIRKDLPRFLLEEVSEARELLRDPKTKDWNISFMTPGSAKENLFTVIYRMTDGFPKCYTVEAVIRNHCLEPEMGSMSAVVLDRTLNQMIRERRGHLQTYPLKSWAEGRYIKEIEIEKKFFDSDTLEIGSVPDSHSDPEDSGDFRNFGISI